jgi:hypothetical protein
MAIGVSGIEGVQMGFLTEASVIVPESVTSEDRARSLFGDNYARLQEIKGRYDPDVLFSKWFVVLPISQIKAVL